MSRCDDFDQLSLLLVKHTCGLCSETKEVTWNFILENQWEPYLCYILFIISYCPLTLFFSICKDGTYYWILTGVRQTAWHFPGVIGFFFEQNAQRIMQVNFECVYRIIARHHHIDLPACGHLTSLIKCTTCVLNPEIGSSVKACSWVLLCYFYILNRLDILVNILAYILK